MTKWNHRNKGQGDISYLEVTTLEMIHRIGHNQLQNIEGKKHLELTHQEVKCEMVKIELPFAYFMVIFIIILLIF